MQVFMEWIQSYWRQHMLYIAMLHRNVSFIMAIIEISHFEKVGHVNLMATEKQTMNFGQPNRVHPFYNTTAIVYVHIPPR